MYLKYQNLTSEVWYETIQKLQQENSWMLWESVTDAQLSDLDTRKIPRNSYRGSIFNPSGEWKWRAISKVGYRCVFIGTLDWSHLTGDDSEKVRDLIFVEDNVLLWGEFNDKERAWQESNISKHLYYRCNPENAQNGDRAKLQIRKWCNAKTYKVEFYQYCALC